MEKFGRICKEYMVDEMAKRFRNYPDFFLTSLSKVGASELEKLRKETKKNSALYVVAKNTLLKKALSAAKKDINLEEVTPLIIGSCGVLFSKDDPAVAAKSLVDFGKKNENFKIQGGFVSGETISVDMVNHLALLPSREVLLAMVAAGMKSPISGFVGLLGNLIRNLVGVIDAISKKRSES